MLTFYYRFARRLYRFRVPLWFLGGISICTFCSALFLSNGSIDSDYALVSLTLLLWALWLLAVAFSFIDPAPAIDPDASFWRRLGARLRRVLTWILVLGMTALFVLAVAMTSRTLGIVLGG